MDCWEDCCKVLVLTLKRLGWHDPKHVSSSVLGDDKAVVRVEKYWCCLAHSQHSANVCAPAVSQLNLGSLQITVFARYSPRVKPVSSLLSLGREMAGVRRKGLLWATQSLDGLWLPEACFPASQRFKTLQSHCPLPLLHQEARDFSPKQHTAAIFTQPERRWWVSALSVLWDWIQSFTGPPNNQVSVLFTICVKTYILGDGIRHFYIYLSKVPELAKFDS